MKLRKIVLLSLFVASLSLIGCAQNSEETNPDGSTTVTKTYKKGGDQYTEETTTWPDGSTKEAVYIEYKNGDYSEESTEKKADGTEIKTKEFYKEETGINTIDQNTTYADGKEVVYHEEGKREKLGGEESEACKQEFTATETTTFPADNKDGKTKEVTESSGNYELDNQGLFVEKNSSGTTTTNYKDGSKDVKTFSKTEDMSCTKDAAIREESTTTKTKATGEKEEVKEKYIQFNPNGPASAEKSAHSYIYKDTTSTNTDKNGKITSKVQVQIDTQHEDFKGEPERQITTTTNYADGKATGITVETFYPPAGRINDGLYILEKKDADGNTLSTEMEYVFYHGKTYGSSKQTIIILKEAGEKKQAKVTYDSHGKNSLYQQYEEYKEESNGKNDFEFTHKCFINTLVGHVTQFKKSADGKTLSIIKEGDGNTPNDVPAVTGKDFDYILYDEKNHNDWDNFNLSFNSKF